MRKAIIIVFACLAFTIASAQDKSYKGLIVGTTLNLRVSAKSASVLKAGADGLGFYPLTSAGSIKANNAYVSEAKQLIIDLATFDNPLTGIQATEMENSKLSNGKCYDLSGRKVVDGKMPTGVIVKEKRKIVVKP